MDEKTNLKSFNFQWDFLDLIFFSQMCLGVKNFKKCWFICQFRGVLNTAINKLKFDINSLHEPILKGLR